MFDKPGGEKKRRKHRKMTTAHKLHSYKSNSKLTEIRNFDVQMLIEQQVFGLKVSMNHHVTVTVVHAGYDLLEKSPRLVFFQLKTNESSNPCFRLTDNSYMRYQPSHA